MREKERERHQENWKKTHDRDEMPGIYQPCLTTVAVEIRYNLWRHDVRSFKLAIHIIIDGALTQGAGH